MRFGSLRSGGFGACPCGHRYSWGEPGIIPQGVLREVAFLSAVAEVTPHIVLAMATGNVGRAHGLPIGILEKGKAANIVLLDRIKGSVVKDALYFFNKGHLSGISVVYTDGEVKVAGRSQQTPPAERSAIIEGEG